MYYKLLYQQMYAYLPSQANLSCLQNIAFCE